MKYVMISLAALTLLSGAASAQDKIWPCTDLHANWQNAPELQCHQLYMEDRAKTISPVERHAPPPREVPVEIVG